MSEYPKTENLLKRDDNTHKLILGEFREYAFEQVAKWNVTEKIDGTNIRLVLGLNHDYTFGVRGRSDAANLPKNYVEEACPDIDAERMLAALRVIDPDEYAEEMIVYGEGYGPGIQSGADLAKKKSLRIFDVLTFAEGKKPLWRSWGEVGLVAAVLGLETAPVISHEMTTADVIAYVQDKPISIVAAIEGSGEVPMEGVVCRTDPYLYNSRGSRVKFKLKAHDLA